MVHTAKEVDNPPWWQKMVIPLLLFVVVLLIVVNVSMVWRRPSAGPLGTGARSASDVDERLEQVAHHIEALTRTLEALRSEMHKA